MAEKKNGLAAFRLLSAKENSGAGVEN